MRTVRWSGSETDQRTFPHAVTVRGFPMGTWHEFTEWCEQQECHVRLSTSSVGKTLRFTTEGDMMMFILAWGERVKPI